MGFLMQCALKDAATIPKLDYNILSLDGYEGMRAVPEISF